MKKKISFFVKKKQHFLVITRKQCGVLKNGMYTKMKKVYFFFQTAEASGSPQQSHQRIPSHQGQDMNVSMEDGSCSSMTSSQHSYNSLPKGNQIHIDQTPDLLK